jgi:hypothetical protein
MVFGLAWILRGRLTLSPQGIAVRGLLGERMIPWARIEGYRWMSNQLFVYPAGAWWPMNLSHFENQPLLFAWVSGRLPDLNAKDLAQEASEIKSDLTLGLSEQDRAARLGSLRRIVRTINWTGYVAAAGGGVNAVFFDQAAVQLVACTALILVPVMLVGLALSERNLVRLDYREGSLHPEGATGILASSIAVGLISLLDRHTLLGDSFFAWTIPLTAAAAGLWLVLEWERIRPQRLLLAVLQVLVIVFFSGFWAGGSVYQLNKNSDVSEPAWGTTRVAKKRTTRQRTGTNYHVEVAPWSASPGEPVELDVTRATYDALKVGATVEISVRRGALQIPWVDEVRLKKP